jgi:hypothetical protein
MSALTKFINNSKSFEQMKYYLDTKMHITVKENKKNDDVFMLLAEDSADLDNHLVRQANGAMYEKMPNGEYGYKLICANIQKIRHITAPGYTPNFKKLNSVELAEDGTVIRLFFHRNEWRIATNKCFDAFEATWGSAFSFGKLFTDFAYDKINYDMLRRDMTYIFIFKHPLCRHVVYCTHPQIVHVDTINNITERSSPFRLVNIEKSKVCGLDLKQITSHIQTVNQLVEYANNHNKNVKKGPLIYRGLVLKFGFESFLLDFSRFTQLESIRGNNPNIGERYKQVSDEDRQCLRLVYPEFRLLFDECDKSITHPTTETNLE